MGGSYLPTLFGIEASLEEIRSKKPLAYCRPLLDAVREGFSNRFGRVMDPSNVEAVPLFLAMASNTKYKLSYIPPVMLRPSVISKIKNMMLKAAENIVSKDPEDDEPESMNIPQMDDSKGI